MWKYYDWLAKGCAGLLISWFLIYFSSTMFVSTNTTSKLVDVWYFHKTAKMGFYELTTFAYNVSWAMLFLLLRSLR